MFLRNRGFRRKFWGRRKGRRSRAEIANFAISTTYSVPGNTQPNDPAWLYTPVITQSSIWGYAAAGAGSTVIDSTIKSVSLLGMSYYSDYYFTAVADTLFAQSRIFEAIIKTSASNSTGAPDQLFNLFTNELIPNGPRPDPYDLPNRILFRRCCLIANGILAPFSATAQCVSPNITAQMNSTWLPVRRKLRARLQEDEAIYHCVGATNSLAAGNARDLNVLVWGAVAYKIWR